MSKVSSRFSHPNLYLTFSEWAPIEKDTWFPIAFIGQFNNVSFADCKAECEEVSSCQSINYLVSKKICWMFPTKRNATLMMSLPASGRIFNELASKFFILIYIILNILNIRKLKLVVIIQLTCLSIKLSYFT